MKKSKRYRVTEEQLKPVIRFINEGSPYYPAGVTDSNFDELSGAQSDDYIGIFDVENDVENGDLILNLETEHGHTIQKRLNTADKPFVLLLDQALVTQGVGSNMEKYIQSARVDKHALILGIQANGEEHMISIPIADILEIVPGPEGDDYDSGPEPDYDAMYERHREM